MNESELLLVLLCQSITNIMSNQVIDLTNDKAPLSNQEIIDAALNLDLSFLVKAVIVRSRLSSVNTLQLLVEYKKFLAIKVISKDTPDPSNLSPSALIDEAWHSHILYTAKYRAACTALGVTIDHSPAGAEDEESVRENRLLLTTSNYKVLFNQAAPSQFWQLKYDSEYGEVKPEVEDERKGTKRLKRKSALM